MTQKIVGFLKECKLYNWDSDDIAHLINGKCDYMRNSNVLIPDEESVKILEDAS